MKPQVRIAITETPNGIPIKTKVVKATFFEEGKRYNLCTQRGCGRPAAVCYKGKHVCGAHMYPLFKIFIGIREDINCRCVKSHG